MIGLRLTPTYLLTATFVGLAVLLGVGAAYGLAIGAGAAVAVMLVMLLSIRQSTIPEWIKLRRGTKRKMSPSVIASSDNAAVILDQGETEASVWVELTPAAPMGIVSADNVSTTLPEIDLQLLADSMVHGDLVISRLAVATVGHAAVIPGSAASVVTGVIGDTPAYVGGRSFLIVTLQLDQAHPAIKARCGQGSYAEGTHRAVLSAAARIRVLVESQGVRARIMSHAQVESASRDLLVLAGNAVETPAWDHLGDGSDAQAVVFTPTTEVTSDRQAKWRSVPALRTLDYTMLDRQPTGVVESSFAIGYLDRSSRPTLPKSSGLRPLGGRQIQTISRFVPVAGDMPMELPDNDLTHTSAHTWVGGLGLFVGTRGDGRRVFVTLNDGDGGVLYIGGPTQLAQQMILRMSVLAVTVDIRLGSASDNVVRQWQEFVRRLGSPLVTFDDNPDPSVVVVFPGDEASVSDDQIAVVVSDQAPLETATASIVASTNPSTGASELAVTSGSDQITVPWISSSSESRFIVGIDDV